MICKAIYNTRTDARGSIYGRVYIFADKAAEGQPVTGESVEGMPREMLIDAGSKLKILATGEVYVFGGGEWHKQGGDAS